MFIGFIQDQETKQKLHLEIVRKKRLFEYFGVGKLQVPWII
jgi:hypothetical protein